MDSQEAVSNGTDPKDSLCSLLNDKNSAMNGEDLNFAKSQNCSVRSRHNSTGSSGSAKSTNMVNLSGHNNNEDRLVDSGNNFVGAQTNNDYSSLKQDSQCLSLQKTGSSASITPATQG